MATLHVVPKPETTDRPLSFMEIEAELAEILQPTEDGSANPAGTEIVRQYMEASLEKRDRVAHVRRVLSQRMAFAKEEKDRCAAIERSTQSDMDRLDEYIQAVAKATGKTKFEGRTSTISIQGNSASPAPLVTDEAQIPARYWEIVPETRRVNTADLKAALVAGEVIPGVELPPKGSHVRVR